MTYYVGEEKTFTGPEIDGEENPILTWEWAFGDGTTGSGRSVTHSYTTSGTYTVTLTTVNNCGSTCNNSDIIIIESAADYWMNLTAMDNQVSCPVEETRAILAIPELTGVDVIAYDQTTEAYYVPTHLEAGKGFMVYAPLDVAIPLYGINRVITAENTVSALMVGWNLMGPGATDIDMSGVFIIGSAKHEFYPQEFDKATETLIFVNIMHVGLGYWIVMDNFTYTYPGDSLEAGENIMFTGFPSGETTYAWNFDDGVTGVGETTTHTYAISGIYTVTLEIKDAVGNVTAKVSKDLAIGVCPVPTCTFGIT